MTLGASAGATTCSDATTISAVNGSPLPHERLHSHFERIGLTRPNHQFQPLNNVLRY